MSTQALERATNRSEALIAQSQKIDAAAAGAMELFHGAETSTQKELQIAQAIVDLRAALTDEVMQPIMGLMNTTLGFLTDKDPTRPDKDGKFPEPYGIPVVRDVVIQAKMLGFRLVGNEVNIIAGKFYPAKNGFRRKLTDHKSFPGLTDFRDTYEAPRVVEGKGALVKCSATWKRNGKEDKYEAEFAIKVNSGMGADGIVGKAERKLCKRVHDILLGMSTPDSDDLGDGKTIDAETITTSKPVFSGDAPSDSATTSTAKVIEPPAVTEVRTLVEGMGGKLEQVREICKLIPGSQDWHQWSDMTAEQAQTILRGRGKLVASLGK